MVGKRGALILERSANAGLQGRLHQQAPRHDHEDGHNTLRLFERQRRGQKLGVLQKTASTLRLTFFCRRRGAPAGAIVGRPVRWWPGKTPLLGALRLASRQGGSQSAFHLIDYLLGLGAWSLGAPACHNAREDGSCPGRIGSRARRAHRRSGLAGHRLHRHMRCGTACGRRSGLRHAVCAIACPRCAAPAAGAALSSTMPSAAQHPQRSSATSDSGSPPQRGHGLRIGRL